jgi:hypothetical protein
MVRGFAGRTGFAGIQQDAFAVIGLGAAACIGKMIGGITADRFGWGFTAIITLILSGIGIIFIENHLCLAFASMILFQMTKLVTLAATSTVIPWKPASVFGRREQEPCQRGGRTSRRGARDHDRLPACCRAGSGRVPGAGSPCTQRQNPTKSTR